jgi:predicted anti-sigma-YlaC factor YlaD
MTNEEFEDLLPAYLDGELNAEQTARVKEWLDRSPDARASLDAFRELNAVLESRREQVPAVAPYVNAVLRKSLLSRARDVTTVLFSFPAITSLFLVLFGVALYIYRERITMWFEGKATLPETGTLGLEWVRRALLQFSGADIWMVTALYVGLTIAVLLSTSLMLMRYLRD